jgi:hypothetical protein
VDRVISINGLKVVAQTLEYGVERADGTVTDFGDDLLSAALESVTYGGEVKCRTVYFTEWRTNPDQPRIPAGDDQV